MRVNDDCAVIMRLLEFTDSAYPVGTFSFSNGLETAAETGIVHDAASLGEFAADVARRAAFTDGVAALCARRAALSCDYDSVCAADSRAYLCKPDSEARLMTRRMGRKAAELAARLLGGGDNHVWNAVGERWLADITAGSGYGTWPVTQSIVFAACGAGPRELFCSLHYGTLNCVLSAALRCVRVSHYDTQRILFDAASHVPQLYDEASQMALDDMHAFSPQADILASLHEKGSKRMFMN